MVIRPANQGSSIGVSIIHEKDVEAVTKAIDKAFSFSNGKLLIGKRKMKKKKSLS